MPTTHPKSIYWIISLSLLSVLFNQLVSNVHAQVQVECETAVEDAKNAYFEDVETDQAIHLLTNCLSKSAFTHADSIQAYGLLTHCYISKDDLNQAETLVQSLLDMSPAFTSDSLEFKPSSKFVELVSKIQQKQEALARQRSKRGSKKLLWFGLGAAAIGGGVFALISGGSDSPISPIIEKLPDPPNGP